MNSNQLNDKSKYELATSSRRIFARLFDLMLLSILSIGIFCALILWIVVGNQKYNTQLFNSMLLLSFIVSFLIFFTYFIIIPYFFKGYTIFKKIFKIKTHEMIDKKYFFIHLIKKELFIWVILFLLSFIFCFVLFFSNDPLHMINQLFLFDFSFRNVNVVIPIFQFLYVIFFMPTLLLTIHLSLNSKKKSIHDFFSDTCVIYTVPIIEQKESDKIKISVNNDLPGIIDVNELKGVE